MFGACGIVIWLFLKNLMIAVAAAAMVEDVLELEEEDEEDEEDEDVILDDSDVVVEELVDSDVVVEELVDSDVVVEELVDSDVVVEELVESDVVAEELVDSDVVVEELVESDVVVEKLVDSDVVVEKLVDSDVVVEELVDSDVVGAIEELELELELVNEDGVSLVDVSVDEEKLEEELEKLKLSEVVVAIVDGVEEVLGVKGSGDEMGLLDRVVLLLGSKLEVVISLVVGVANVDVNSSGVVAGEVVGSTEGLELCTSLDDVDDELLDRLLDGSKELG